MDNANSTTPAPPGTSLGDLGLNHYQLTNVIRKIQLFGNAEDLHKFRQTSQSFYGFLNPTYLDNRNLTLKLKPYLSLNGESFELMTIRHGLAQNKIDPRTTPWTSQVAKMFRRLYLSDLQINPRKRNFNKFTVLGSDMNLTTLISQIRPCITTLELLGFRMTLRFLTLAPAMGNIQTNVAKFFEFLTQFPNLEQLMIHYWHEQIMREEFTVDDLEVIIRSLISEKPKIKITIQTPFNQVIREDILLKFGFRKFPKNLELVLSIYTLGVLRQLQEFVQHQPVPLKAKLDVRLYNNCLGQGLRVKQDFEAMIAFCLQFQAQIDRLFLTLGFGFMNNEDRVRTQYCDVNDAWAIQNYLSQLSPFLTRLWIKYSADLTMEQEQGQLNIFGIDIFWPKLWWLRITNYAQPLEVLKKTPNLQILHLENVEEDFCIFHKPEQTHEQALEEYFTNLRQLKELEIRDVRSRLIIGQTENQDKLKRILPKLKKLSIELNYGSDNLFLM